MLLSTGDPNDNPFIGPPLPLDPSEMGWKDTVRANPGEVTRIIARFGPFTGIYPWHCHILEHEDHDMMRPYEVSRKILTLTHDSDSRRMS